jgi:glycosyltransferase involved in cell wall biosynthesis
MKMLTWENAHDQISQRIATSRGFLKIILKTLDESSLLESWIEHHRRIVGLSNIIIADNGSTDLDVLSIYEKYFPDLLVFQFEGFHNFIHDRKLFPQLYEALAASSEYILFLDSDERLIRIDGDASFSDTSIVDEIRRRKPAAAIPTTWLFNASSSTEVFSIGSHIKYLTNNLKWGKPIRRSSISLPGPLIHNYQFPASVFADNHASNLFLLHLVNYSREQRLKANRNKLIARGFADRTMTYDEIVSLLKMESNDQTIDRCVREMRLLLDDDIGDGSSTYFSVPSQHMQIAGNGDVKFAGDAERALFRSYMDNSSAIIKDTLGTQRFDVVDVPRHDPVALRKLALEQLEQGHSAEAEWILETGMELYPTELDIHSHPTFRKELIRVLLAHGAWEDAHRLVPAEGSFGGSHWHEIMFARAYSASDDRESAKACWMKVLASSPKDAAEAMAALAELR